MGYRRVGDELGAGHGCPIEGRRVLAHDKST